MAGQVPVVPMDRGNNTTCTINLHGATIVSWRVNNQVRIPLVPPFNADLMFGTKHYYVDKAGL